MAESTRSPAALAWLAVAVLLVACAESAPPGEADTNPPKATPANVLIILLDDLGYNDIHAYNSNPLVDTPNLDDFARQGSRFTRHYASAVCAPARAALLTGLHPARQGFMPSGRGISPQVVTLPERLSAAGYQTAHIGKWHLGSLERGAWPDRQGFDQWFGFLDQWRLAGQDVDEIPGVDKPRYNNPWLQGSSEAGRHVDGHLEDILTERAITTLSQLANEQRPWFLNLWYFAPHTPVTPAPEYAGRYPDSEAGRYRALVNQLDHNIGRILDALEATGQAHNTLVVITSDNGGTNKAIDNNAPFHGSKNGLLEGSLRTPLMIRWPGRGATATVREDIVITEDIYPTVLSVLNLEQAESLDGRSLYPPAEPAAPRPLFWKHVGNYSLLTADGRWRYVFPWGYDSAATAIAYDLMFDPTGETAALPHPAAAAEARAAVEAWIKRVHEVPLSASPEADAIAWDGMDFQRSPGHGEYSLGLALRGRQPGTLLEQAGILRIERTADEARVILGDHELGGPLRANAACHSLVLTGRFEQRRSIWVEDRIRLRLYIDGEQVDSLDAPGRLPVADLSAPTRVYTRAKGDDASLRVLNIAVDDHPVWQLAEFGESLCSGS